MGNSCENLQESVSQMPVAPYDESTLWESPLSSTSREESPLVLGQASTSMPAEDFPRLGLFGKTTPFGGKASPTSSGGEWDSRDFIDDDDSPVVDPPVASTSLALPFLAFFPATSCALSEASTRRLRRHVTFASSPTHSVHCSVIEIQPYSEVYGMHPRDFDFNEHGEKVPSVVGTLSIEDIGYDWQNGVGMHPVFRAEEDSDAGDVLDDGRQSCGLQQWWGPPPTTIGMSGYASTLQVGADQSLYSDMHVE